MITEKQWRVAAFISLFIVLIFGSGLLIWQTSELETVPSCIYGCTGWLSQSMIKSVINEPTDLWGNSGLAYTNHPEIMPKFYAQMSGQLYLAFKGVFGWDYLSSWRVTIFVGVLAFLFFTILFFFLFKRISVTDFSALALALIAAPFGMATGYKSFATASILLFFLLLYFVARERKFDWKAGLVALLFVVVNQNHPTVPIITGFLALGYLLVTQWRHLRYLRFKPIIKDREVQVLVIILIVGGVLTLLTPWWSNALFVSEGSAAHAMKINDSFDFSQPSVYFSFLWRGIKTLLFRFSSLFNIIGSLLAIAGISALVLFKAGRKRNPARELAFVGLLGYVFTTFHYLISTPLFGTDLAPDKAFTIALPIAIVLLGNYGLQAYGGLLKNENLLRWGSVALLALVVLSLVLLSANRADSQAYQQAEQKSPNQQIMESVYTQYLAPNGINPKETIIISTNEISTALNTMIGTQLVNGRFAHYYRWMDFQPYWYDTAVVLYSNDSQQRKEVLLRYLEETDELYVYWDYYWPNSEYVFNQQGQFVHYYNPIKFLDESYAPRLAAQNISTFQDHQGFEPNTYGVDEYRSFDLTILSPENYRQGPPWSPQLTDVLEEVWSVDMQGQTVARLFKVDRLAVEAIS